MGDLVRWRPCAYALAAAMVCFSTAAEGTDYQVRAGDDLQRVLDLAQPGDVIYLQAGAIFRGNYVLNAKAGSAYITIRSSTADSLLPPAGTRLTPGHASLLPKLESPTNEPVIRTAAGAHHWRLLFLELGPTKLGFGEILRLGEGWIEQSLLSQVPYDIEIDRVYIHGHPLYGQKRGIAMNGRSVTIKNSWISDIKAVGMDTQAIGGWNGPGPLLVENNYLESGGENIMFGGADPAIQGLITEDITIRHNYVTRPLSWRDPIVASPKGVTWSAATGTLASGTYAYRIVARRAVGNGSVGKSLGTDVVVSASGGVRLTWASVPDAEDYVVYGRRANAFDQYWVVATPAFTDTGAAGTSGAPPASLGDAWLVKNLFELKNARRVVVENNVFENNWPHGQAGYAILFTPRNQDGRCTWCVVSDVRFEYNVVRNVGAGLNILGYDYPNVSQQTSNITIRHNLFERITTRFGGNAWFLLMGLETRNLIIDHNTIDHDGTTILYAYSAGDTPAPMSGFQFTNNAVRHGDYGINGAGTGYGTQTLTAYFPGAIFSRNWLAGGTAARYPAGNYFSGTFLSGFVGPNSGDWRAASGSVLIGSATDGTDIGAAISTLMTRVSHVVSGNPAVGGLPQLSAAPPRAPSGTTRVLK
jgi:hypothetical protein